MAGIILRDVSVHLPIYNARGRDLKSTILRRTVGGSVEQDADKSVIVVKALHEVNLDLVDGDRVGLIGHNGAGKTTLLRVLAGIFPPTSGTAVIRGRVSPMTDLMMGMDLEATGYENIYLRAIVMGLTKRAALALRDEVAAFSELGEYLHLPMRTYSTGMMLRLAFAVSTAVQPEILILDEMIGAGDASFIAKAQGRIESLMRAASIMVLASHDDSLVRQFCSKCIWLEGGRIVQFGETGEVINSRNAAT